MKEEDVEKLKSLMVILDHNDKPTGYSLSKHFIKENDVSVNEVAALQTSHKLKSYIFHLAENAKCDTELKFLAEMFDALEFEQQELWGFDRNRNFHYFFDLPGCKCPKMDNRDWIGTGRKIYSGDCPIHGNKGK